MTCPARTPRRWLFTALVAFALATAAAAEAGNPVAEQLFQDAVTLMEAGNYADAAAKLEKSQELEARSGTLLDLAYCHEKLGRTATAWVEYKDAASLARAESRPDNEEKATSLAEALEPSLSRLAIDVEQQAGTIAAEVDGQPVVTGSPFPVDPGERVVKVRAEGKKEWSTTITIAPGGDTKTIVVPELEPVAAPVPEPPPPPKAPPPPHEEEHVDGSVPTWAWVTGAAGIVIIGIAIGFAVDQTAAGNAVESSCGDDRQSCPPDYDFAADWNRERRDFGVFLGLGAGGLVALGAGVAGAVVGLQGDF
jgi:hypothetical protein